MHRILILLLLQACTAFAETAQVPLGDRVDSSILNYHRMTTEIATSGKIGDGGLDLLKNLGFRTILDLRTAAEGTATERDEATARGIAYHNIEIGAAPPTSGQLAEFTSIVEQSGGYPLLIHCASANRVGTLWAMYRVSRGVPVEEALQEGRTIGMRPSRESQVTDFAAAAQH